MQAKDFDGECPHCAKRNWELHCADQYLCECYDCGKLFRIPGAPPLDLPTLLVRTREGLEVHGTLEAFSIHYPPATGSDYLVEDDDMVAFMFQPDLPSWDQVWVEVAELPHMVKDSASRMMERYPYTPAPIYATKGD